MPETPILLVPNDPLGFVMAYSEPAARHALRSTCVRMYRLPAAGALRLPLQSPHSLALCVERARFHLHTTAGQRISFWGTDVSRLALVVANVRPESVLLTSGMCQAVAPFVTNVSASIELWYTGSCDTEVITGALEIVAHLPTWQSTGIELRHDKGIGEHPYCYAFCGPLHAEHLSPLLRARLTWCDAVLLGKHGPVPTFPFPRLRNARADGNSHCLVYLDPKNLPSLVCVEAIHINDATDLINRLAPVAGRLERLVWRTSCFTDYPVPSQRLVVGPNTEVDNRGDGMFPPQTGRLLVGKIRSLADLTPHNLACRRLEFRLYEDTCPAILELLHAQVPAHHVTLTPNGTREVTHMQLAAAERAVQCAGAAASLEIDPELITETLVGVMSRSVKTIVLTKSVRNNREGLRMLLLKPGLRRLVLSFVYLEDLATATLCIADIRRTMDTPIPAVYVAETQCVHVQRWSALDDAGIFPRDIRLSVESFAEPPPVPATTNRWSREVQMVELVLPLGPGFCRHASALATFLPCVTRVVLCGHAQAQADAENAALCEFLAGLGPCLRRIDGWCGARDARFEAACPWLYPPQ